MSNLRRAGSIRAIAVCAVTVRAITCRRTLQRAAKGHRGTEICRVQSIDMPLELLLELVGRLLRILAQAGLVDIATVHANVTVDDHHRARTPSV